MLANLSSIKEEIINFNIDNKDSLEQFRIKFLSKKGIIPQLFESFKNVEPAQKKDYGVLINELKVAANEKLETFSNQFDTTEQSIVQSDLSLPANSMPLGSRHPISIIKNEICAIFSKLGYVISEGPEIEDDWHVFGALNFAPDHPARDMQDTFFVNKKEELLLRTHTSSVQIRIMEKTQPPIRILMPGRVFRNEAISARAHCVFHQIEGLYIDENVSFADLKQNLLFFARELFGSQTKIRLRPSYFPFTEPSAEMDVSCSICGGKGCNICKYSGWLEVLGCGMVHPNVLENCKIDSKKYTGFAFGMGIERIVMLKYQIKDLRLYFESDLRFLKQFTSAY